MKYYLNASSYLNEKFCKYYLDAESDAIFILDVLMDEHIRYLYVIYEDSTKLILLDREEK